MQTLQKLKKYPTDSISLFPGGIRSIFNLCCALLLTRGCHKASKTLIFLIKYFLLDTESASSFKREKESNLKINLQLRAMERSSSSQHTQHLLSYSHIAASHQE